MVLVVVLLTLYLASRHDVAAMHSVRESLRRAFTSRRPLDLVAVVLLCIGLALMVANPESRVVVAVIDAVGFDVFVLLIATQLRQVPLLIAWAKERWYEQLQVPGYRLTFESMRVAPLLAAYVLTVPVAVLALVVFLGQVCARCIAP